MVERQSGDRSNWEPGFETFGEPKPGLCFHCPQGRIHVGCADHLPERRYSEIIILFSFLSTPIFTLELSSIIRCYNSWFYVGVMLQLSPQKPMCNIKLSTSSVCFSVKMAFIYIDLKNFSGHSSRFSGELRFKTLFFFGLSQKPLYFWWCLTSMR